MRIHDQAIEKWLSPADISANHANARQLCHPGTGQWLLKSPEFISWKTQSRSFLWLSGNSGRGKTVLTSTILQDLQETLQNTTCAILCFYLSFSDNRKQSLQDILRSLVNQLYRDRPETRHHLKSLWSDCRNGSEQPSVNQLQEVFQKMLQAANDVYIVIDALDEFEGRSNSRSDLLAWTQSFQVGLDNVHLLVTSRPEDDIKSSIEKWARAEDIICLRTNQTGHDIAEYIHAEVTSSQDFARWKKHKDVQEEIEDALKQKAYGV
jgi:hypothetical protein